MATIHSSTAEQVLALSADRFDDNATHDLVLVHFASPLFSGSHVVAEQLRDLPGELDDFIEFHELSLDSENPSIIRTFKIEQLPTLLVFCNGEAVERIEAVLDHEELETFLRDVVSFYVAQEGPGRAENSRKDASEKEEDL